MIDRLQSVPKAGSHSSPIHNDISIIIPTLGRPILDSCLQHIVAGSVWPQTIIVVDQGRKRDIAQIVERIRESRISIRYVPSEGCGRAAGINLGLELAKTPYVAITDDDCFVDVNWLKNMVASLETHPGSIITGRVEAGGSNVILVVTSNAPEVYHKPRLRFDRISGGNMGAPLGTLKRIGLLDEHESLRTAEDGELAYRALRAGVPIVYNPEISVIHSDWRDGSQRYKQYRDYAYSLGGFYGKYLRQGDWFIALRAATNYIRAAKRCFIGVVTGNQELIRNGFAYLVGHFPGIIAGLRRGDRN